MLYGGAWWLGSICVPLGQTMWTVVDQRLSRRRWKCEEGGGGWRPQAVNCEKLTLSAGVRSPQFPAQSGTLHLTLTPITTHITTTIVTPAVNKRIQSCHGSWDMKRILNIIIPWGLDQVPGGTKNVSAHWMKLMSRQRKGTISLVQHSLATTWYTTASHD